MDFSIQVLSSGSWPFQQSCTFALPSEVRVGEGSRLCTLGAERGWEQALLVGALGARAIRVTAQPSRLVHCVEWDQYGL